MMRTVRLLFASIVFLSATNARAFGTLTLSDGSQMSCELAEQITFENTSASNYLCKGKQKTALFNLQDSYSSAVVNENGKIYSGQVSRFDLDGVTQYEERVFSDQLSAYQTLDAAKITLDSMDPNNAILPLKSISKNGKVAAEFDQLRAAWKREASKRARTVLTPWRPRDLEVTLSGGTILHCRRGTEAPPDEITMAIDADRSCKVFVCTGKNGTSTILPIDYDPPAEEATYARLLQEKNGTLMPHGEIARIAIPNGKTIFTSSNTNNAALGDSADLPEPFRPYSEELRIYSMPSLWNQRNWMFSRCTDQEIKNFVKVEGKQIQAMYEQLGRTPIVQVFDVVNRALSSFYTPANQLPTGACSLAPNLFEVARVENFDLSPYLKQEKLTPISLEEANNLFSELKGRKDIPTHFLPSGCEARGHVIAKWLESQGVTAGKIFIMGNLYLKGHPKVKWNGHTAAVISVTTSEGQIETRVMDTTLGNHPLTIQEWTGKIGLPVGTQVVSSLYPPPSNATIFNRAVLVQTSSDVYWPPELPATTQKKRQEQMQRALLTMAKDLYYQDHPVETRIGGTQ